MAAPMKPREFHFPDVDTKLTSDHACLSVIQREIPIGLSPRYIKDENEFIKQVLSSKLGKFDNSLQCIPVSIQGIKRFGTTGIILDEDPNIYFKVLAEFVVFQPVVSSKVTARVEKLSASHIGLLVHEWFNASVARDHQAKQVGTLSVGDEVLLEVIRPVVNRRILSLECKLISILKKAQIVINNTAVGLSTHKSFPDQEEGQEDSTSKKRPRSDALGSDSGVDFESNALDGSFTDGKPSLKGPAKKKKRKDKHNDESSHEVTTETINSHPVMSPMHSTKSPKSAKKSPNKPHKSSTRHSNSDSSASPRKAIVFDAEAGECSLADNSVNSQDTKSLCESVSLPSQVAASVNESEMAINDDFLTSPQKTKKKKKKHRHGDGENEALELSSFNESQLLAETESSGKKKKKKRHDLSDTLEIESNIKELSQHETQVSDSSTVKKKRKKKHKSDME